MSDHPLHLPPRTPAAAQPPATYRPTPEEAELIRLSQEWMKIALVEKDEQRLRRLMAPEFTLQIWDASRAAQDLDSWMHVLLHRLADIELKYTSLNAQVFGSMGVVYSTFWWTARWMGNRSLTPVSWPTLGRVSPALGGWSRDEVHRNSKSSAFKRHEGLRCGLTPRSTGPLAGGLRAVRSRPVTLVR